MSELSDAWYSPYGAQTVDLATDYIDELESLLDGCSARNESDADKIAKLEDTIAEWREERDSIREEREQLKAENRRLHQRLREITE